MGFLFVWLFAAALHQPQAHELPVGVVGPASVADTIAAALEAKAPGAFVISSLSCAAAARTAIHEREIAGALVVGSGRPLIMVASANGEATSNVISGALAAVVGALGQSAALEDVQSLPVSDSRGLVPFFLVLGVSVSAFIFQVVSRLRSGPFHFTGGSTSTVGFAILDGFLAALAVSVVLGFDESYWLLAGVCTLLALAVAAATAACYGLFGKAGVGVAGLVLILLGNASSGSVIGSAFLAQPFRSLSPVLPAGPGLEATRSTLYFEGAGLGWSLWTLALWIVGSFVVLACVAGAKTWARRTADVPV